MSRDLSGLTSSAADWSGLRATVAGIGVAGLAAADALLDLGAQVTVVDSGDGDKQRERADLVRTNLSIYTDNFLSADRCN